MKEKNKTSQKWAITLFTIGVFMAGLDNGIISTALTTINDSFSISPSWGAWSITLYTLGIAVSVPIIGKLSDKFGRKRLFIIEIILFGIGSLLVAFSPNFIFLLIARLIQSIGGGGIFIIGSSHILAALPKDKQGKALGMLGGMNGFAAVIGPNLGAVILDITGSWHWLFLINIPIAIFLIVFGFLKIDETKPGTSKPLDLVGTALLACAILALMFGITNLNSQAVLESITQVNVAPFLLIGIILLLALVYHERQVENRGGDPILAFSLLKKRLFQITLILGLLSGGFLAGIIFIPAYVQQVLQVPVENAGYWLTPLAVSSGIGAGLGGVLTDRKGPAKTIILSGVVGVIGFLLFPFTVDGVWTFTLASILAGIGLGILLGAPLNVLVGESARSGEQGSALGTLSLIRQIGMTLFPTIYAGFMTGGFSKLQNAVEQEFGNNLLDFSKSSEANYGNLIEQIEMISNTELQVDILKIVTDTLKTAFSQMFITASILAALVLLTGCYLHYRNKSAYQNK
ncbi:MFS transporter [Virgibacillus oceani]|uniref:MFS-type transporter YfiU n=1 Tax=Virgibacillus oceani TaxID=1479511 RepID=A0A917H9A8_9BACI|nr:putative MFS-type transporter YfiU [Virgibacillus oceani]